MRRYGKEKRDDAVTGPTSAYILAFHLLSTDHACLAHGGKGGTSGCAACPENQADPACLIGCIYCHSAGAPDLGHRIMIGGTGIEISRRVAMQHTTVELQQKAALTNEIRKSQAEA